MFSGLASRVTHLLGDVYVTWSKSPKVALYLIFIFVFGQLVIYMLRVSNFLYSKSKYFDRHKIGFMLLIIITKLQK